ncbi:MAG: histidine phosphatase family protein [Flavobacteriales bacterium]|nr:histidine phosphatase family protein [Flavobacteriales bacterium]
MKTLYIIRHAKSSWSQANVSDFDRTLNDRGFFDAPLMGKVLKGKGILPDAIYASTAKRALLTTSILTKEISFTKEINKEPEYYHASASSLLQKINQFPDDLNTVFVVGHNPGLTYLAEDLSNDHFGNLPTCGIVGIRFEFDSWAMISAGTGECFYYDYPKNHK